MQSISYFKTYSSNTLAGSSNQCYFISDGQVHTARIFYKIFCSGKYEYSFLFSNTIDSTYSDGNFSRRNFKCDEFEITALSASAARFIDPAAFMKNSLGDFPEFNMDYSEAGNDEIGIKLTSPFKSITFNGAKGKTVNSGELFYTDPTVLEFNAGEYICIEISFKGSKIPCHPESLMPTFLETDGKWKYSKDMPVPSMIGCNRFVKLKIGYFGDSITQGIGTEINSYSHWNAAVSERLGKDFAFWNLGIGFARASDAATDGAWIFKAKQNDIVTVCFGVNDILNKRSKAEIKADIEKTVGILTNSNIKVLLQTVPPFDYKGDDIKKWENINRFIKTEIPKKYKIKIFDTVPFLSAGSEHSYNAKFGGHPDKRGCKIWADKIYGTLKEIINETV